MNRRLPLGLSAALFALLFLLAAAPEGWAEARLEVKYLGSINRNEEAGPLYFPFAAFIDQARDEIYVIDGKGRVIIYNSGFFPLVTIGKGSGILSPTSAAVDEAGNVYIAQTPGKGVSVGKISVLDACLRPLRQIGFSGFPGAEAFSPQRIVRHPDGRLFAVGTGVSGIVVIETDGSQRLINPAGRDFEGEPRFSALGLDGAGNLYAVSEEFGRVYVLDSDLKKVRHFGVKGGSSGKLSRPQGVAADPARGLYYVVDYMRHGVTVYDAAGKYLNEFGGLGIGAGWFQYPKDVALDSTGRLFVVDTFNQRVQVFRVKPQAGEPAEQEPPEAAPQPPGPVGGDQPSAPVDNAGPES